MPYERPPSGSPIAAFLMIIVGCLLILFAVNNFPTGIFQMVFGSVAGIVCILLGIIEGIES